MGPNVPVEGGNGLDEVLVWPLHCANRSTVYEPVWAFRVPRASAGHTGTERRVEKGRGAGATAEPGSTAPWPDEMLGAAPPSC